MKLYRLSRIRLRGVDDIGNSVNVIVIAEDETEARKIASHSEEKIECLRDDRFLDPAETTCEVIDMSVSQLVLEDIYSYA